MVAVVETSLTFLLQSVEGVSGLDFGGGGTT